MAQIARRQVVEGVADEDEKVVAVVGAVVEDEDETIYPICSPHGSLEIKDERCKMCSQCVYI
jgi:hypothetical protein